MMIPDENRVFNEHSERDYVAALDTAEKRIADLEGEVEELKYNSEEFGGDCWIALRSLLNECGWDWSADPEVTADEAREYISITLDHLRATIDRAKKSMNNLEFKIYDNNDR